MINSIDSLHRIGRFKRFAWDAAVPAFSKVNLVFGDNGSGKTTLSNVLRLFGRCGDSEEVFRDLSSGEVPRVVVTIDGNSVPYEREVAKQALYAFNIDFVAEHVFDGSALNCLQFDSAVVTSDQLTNPRIKDIESRIESVASQKDEHERARNQLQASFDAIKRRLADDLNARVRGARAPSMSMPDVAPEVTSAECAGRLAAAYEEYIRAEGQERLGADKTAVEALSFAALETSVQDVLEVLSRSVPARARQLVQTRIEALSGLQLPSGTVRDWFDAGSQLLKHVKHSGGQTCPLCGSDLTAKLSALVTEYEAYFSKEFAGLMGDISRAIRVIDEDLQRLESNEKSLLMLESIEARNAALFGALQSTASGASYGVVQNGSMDRNTLLRDMLTRLRAALAVKKENVDRIEQDAKEGGSEELGLYNEWVKQQSARQLSTARRLAPSERSSADVVREIRSLIERGYRKTEPRILDG